MTASTAEVQPQGYVPPTPNPIQQMFLDAPATDFVHFGTGKGVGKSFGILFREARDHQLYKDKANTLIIRSTFQSLQEIQNILDKHLIHWFPGTTWSSGEDLFKLGGKAAPLGTIELAYSATSPTEQIRSLARLQGRSKTLLILDECGALLTRDFVDGCAACRAWSTHCSFIPEQPWRSRASLAEADVCIASSASLRRSRGTHKAPTFLV